jgi:hypothetical protein
MKANIPDRQRRVKSAHLPHQIAGNPRRRAANLFGRHCEQSIRLEDIHETA